MKRSTTNQLTAPLIVLVTGLSLGLLATPIASASTSPTDVDGDAAPMSETMVPLIERAITAGWEHPVLEEVFLAALLEHGDITPVATSLEERIKTAAEAEPGSRSVDPVRRLLCFLHWRNGDLRLATQTLEQIPAEARTLNDRLHTAELLDAGGRNADAKEAYQALVDNDGAELDDSQEARLRLRLALMGIDRRGNDGEEASELFRYAKEDLDDTELKNRAAIVLALSKRPKEAGELYSVDGEGSKRFKQEIRLAEWALGAGDVESAREIAWRARESATLRRDRWYALSVLVEAWREGDQLDILIDRFASEQSEIEGKTNSDGEPLTIDKETREVWIDLLRERGRLDDALALFRESASTGFTFDMRRELLEMCRESGRDDILVDAYRELIADEPGVMEWREGLARHFLERGDRDAAIALWRDAMKDPALENYLLAAADSMSALGLDDLAMESAERCITEDRSPYQALLFRFSLLRDRGRRPEAEAELERMDKLAPAMAPERMSLAEAFEQIGRLERAVEVLEGVREARGPEKAGEDLEMRLAWLHSEVGDEDTAMERWLDLWQRVESLSRRRYVEDRLMTVASRIGKLADIAISLEERLAAGDADEKDAGLLVRLYSKANDPVSAAEIIEEHMKRSGSSAIEILREKARVYQECNDFHSFEQVMHQLITKDPENRVDHLRQLAMSALERGRPDEAKDVLAELRALEGGAVGAEFEAGVLALSGLRDEALLAYRTGLASHKDRIEVYLLLANVLRDTGKTSQAIGMFQYLAEHAEKDDLFTIAIDGLLNMEAPPAVVRWARRITLERLTRRHDKMYLYQLISDLSDEVNDTDTVLLALEGSLPIAGEQRASILRELMDRTGATRPGQPSRDEKRHLSYGRRLIGLGDIVPPQVYLDLGDAFLKNDEVTNASKTFNLASDVPDYAAFQRQIATSFERARFLNEALRVYERVLIGEPSNVSLLTKVAELHEQLGRDDLAADIFGRAMDLMLARRPSTDDKVQDDDETDDDPFARYWARNVTDFEQYKERVLRGLVVTTETPAAATRLLRAERSRIDEDLAEALPDAVASDRPLDAFPRVRDRAEYHRALAMAFHLRDDADALDLRILKAFPKDDSLLRALVKERMQQGRVGSARRLIEGSGRTEEEMAKVRYLAGAGAIDPSDRGTIRLPEVTRLFLPLIAGGKLDDARRLIERGDFTSYDKDSVEAIGMLFSAAAMLEDADLMLILGRHWITGIVHAENQVGNTSYQIESVLEKCGRVLDPERYRSLGQSIVGLILDEKKKDQTRDLVRLLPSLTRRFPEPLLTDEELEQILESRLDGNVWGLGPILEMMPAEKRASIVRGMWPKIQKTTRAMFLLNLAGELQEDATKELEDLLVDSMEGAIADTDDKEFLSYYVDGIVAGKKNRRLAERLLSTMIASGADADSIKLSHALLLHQAGATEQALESVTPTLRELFAHSGDNRDWQTEEALDQLLGALVGESLDAILAILDDVEEENGPSTQMSMRRIAFAERKGDPKATVALIEDEQKKHPEDDALLSRLERAYNANNRRMDALGLLAQRAENEVNEKTRERHLTRLASSWESIRHASRALDVWADIDGEDEDSIEEDVEKETERKIGRPNLIGIRDALARGDQDEARLMLRRLWRGDSPIASGSRVVYFSPFGRGNAQLAGFWPATPVEEEAGEGEKSPKAREWPRGGLPSWVTEDPEVAKAEREAKTKDQQRTYDVLVAEPFGRDELARHMRIMTGPQLSRAQDLFKALANERMTRLGPLPAFEEALGRIQSGEASTQDYGILLEFLSSDRDEFTSLATPVLAELLNTTRPDDGQSLRRIAQTLARTGDTSSAAALYRWCATTSDAGPVYYAFDTGSTRVSSAELVKDVKKHLDGELRLNVVEKILDWADPGRNRWMRENYENLVLSTWSEVLGPEAALARCRDLCESLMAPLPGEEREPPAPNPLDPFDDGIEMPHRSAAKAAATLLARAGEIEAALRCLETALTNAETEDESGGFGMRTVYVSGGGTVTYFGGGGASFGGVLSRTDLERLYPFDASEFLAPVEWMVGSAERVHQWVTAERVSPSNATQILTVIALRLHALGASAESSRALALAREAGEREGGRPSLLWVADASASIGDTETAKEIQHGLLQAGALTIERIPETVEQILNDEGPAAALGAGTEALAVTHHPRLLETLARAAAGAGDSGEAARFNSLAVAEQTAEDALEARRQALAEKAKREKALR